MKESPIHDTIRHIYNPTYYYIIIYLNTHIINHIIHTLSPSQLKLFKEIDLI